MLGNLIPFSFLVGTKAIDLLKHLSALTNKPFSCFICKCQILRWSHKAIFGRSGLRRLGTWSLVETYEQFKTSNRVLVVWFKILAQHVKATALFINCSLWRFLAFSEQLYNLGLWKQHICSLDFTWPCTYSSYATLENNIWQEMTEFLKSHGYAAKSVFQSQQLHNQKLRSCEKQMADCNLSWLI